MIIVFGEIGVKFVVEVMKEIYNFYIDVIVFVMRNVEFLFVILKVKEKGKEIVVIGVELGFLVVFKYVVDYMIIFGGE